MKNSITAILLSVTLAFAAFTAGYFLGQNSSGPDIHISGIPSPTSPTSPSTQGSQEPLPTQGVTPSQPTQSNSTQPTVAPTAPTEPTTPTTAATEPEVSFPININTATAEQLDVIPGIGPVLAKRIIDYRTEIGGFTDVEELLEVKGIGEKTLEKILEYITV